MNAKIRALITFSLGLSAMAAAGLLLEQRATHRALTAELAGTPVVVVEKLKPVVSPPGGGVDRLLKPFAAKSGDEARREMVRLLQADADSGRNRDPLNHLTSLVECLSAEELLAVIGTEFPARFTMVAQGLNKEPRSDIDEALARLAALRRLCIVAPEQALACCAAGVPAKPADPLFNVAASALRQIVRENPASAIRWCRDNAAWLPASWPAWILPEVARLDGFSGAVALARREGLLLAESMGGFDTGSLTLIDNLMTEVNTERVADPDAFAENSSVMKGYQKVAAKIANTFGFGEARKFAEKWTAGLPWQEDIAQTAFLSTLLPESTPETEAAADWVMGFVPEDRRHAVAGKVIDAWTETDFAPQAGWLEKHWNAPWRDAGVAALCHQMADADPEAAVQWAATISDPDLRTETLSTLSGLP